MRSFVATDGRKWTASRDGSAAPRGAAAGVGWDAILFESADAPAQRLIYRAAGWLAAATEADLRAALEDSELVRTTWGSAR